MRIYSTVRNRSGLKQSGHLGIRNQGELHSMTSTRQNRIQNQNYFAISCFPLVSFKWHQPRFGIVFDLFGLAFLTLAWEFLGRFYGVRVMLNLNLLVLVPEISICTIFKKNVQQSDIIVGCAGYLKAIKHKPVDRERFVKSSFEEIQKSQPENVSNSSEVVFFGDQVASWRPVTHSTV